MYYHRPLRLYKTIYTSRNRLGILLRFTSIIQPSHPSLSLRTAPWSSLGSGTRVLGTPSTAANQL